MSSEIEDLKARVAQLEALVKKQSVLISKTGKTVLELQVDKQKQDIEDFDKKFIPTKSASSSSYSKFDATDFATNDDLVQLVEELQGQLEAMDERSIRRAANQGIQNGKDNLAPVPNAYGEIPDVKDGVFPMTLADFENIADLQLAKLAWFYELMAPSSKFLKLSEDSALETKLSELHVSPETPSDEELEKDVKEMSSEQLCDLFNDVARYIGVKCRRGTSLW